MSYKDKETVLKTCLVIVTGLVIIYLLKEWKPLIIIAASVGLAGILFEKPASWLTWTWFKAGDLLGKVVPNIILSGIYFLFLSPIALAYRIFTSDEKRFRTRSRHSTWIDRDHDYLPEDLKRPW